MNAKLTFPVAIAALTGLLGCNTPQSAETARLEPLPTYEFHGGPSQPRPLISGSVCKLGTSCLALDPRPFEPCLLSTKYCSDKSTEPLLVAPDPSIIPPPRIIPLVLQDGALQ